MKKKFLTLTVVLPLVLATSACEFSHTSKTSIYPEVKVSGSEIWTIDTIEHEIAGTANVIYPGEKPVYSIKSYSKTELTEAHDQVAKQLAQYAIEKGYYEKAVSVGVITNNKMVELSPNISVSISYKDKEGMIPNSKVRKYEFSPADIAGDISTGG